MDDLQKIFRAEYKGQTEVTVGALWLELRLSFVLVTRLRQARQSLSRKSLADGPFPGTKSGPTGVPFGNKRGERQKMGKIKKTSPEVKKTAQNTWLQLDDFRFLVTSDSQTETVGSVKRPGHALKEADISQGGVAAKIEVRDEASLVKQRMFELSKKPPPWQDTSHSTFQEESVSTQSFDPTETLTSITFDPQPESSSSSAFKGLQGGHIISAKTSQVTIVSNTSAEVNDDTYIGAHGKSHQQGHIGDSSKPSSSSPVLSFPSYLDFSSPDDSPVASPSDSLSPVFLQVPSAERLPEDSSHEVWTEISLLPQAAVVMPPPVDAEWWENEAKNWRYVSHWRRQLISVVVFRILWEDEDPEFLEELWHIPKENTIGSEDVESVMEKTKSYEPEIEPILVGCQLEETQYKKAPERGENNSALQAEADDEGLGSSSIVSTVDQIVANNLNHHMVEVPHTGPGEEMQQASCKEIQPVEAIVVMIEEAAVREGDINREAETGLVEEVEASNMERQPSDESSTIVVEIECPSEIEVNRVTEKELGELGEDVRGGNNEGKQIRNENLAILTVSEGLSGRAEHQEQVVVQDNHKVGECLSENLYILVEVQKLDPGESGKLAGGTVVGDGELEASRGEVGQDCDGKRDILVADELLTEGKVGSEMKVLGQKEESQTSTEGDDQLTRDKSHTQENEGFSQGEGEKPTEIISIEVNVKDSLSSVMGENSSKVDMEAEQHLEGSVSNRQEGSNNEIKILNEIDEQERNGDVSNIEEEQKPRETMFSMIGGWPDGGNQEGFGGEEEGEEWTAGKVVGWTEMQAEDHIDTRHEEVGDVVIPVEGQFPMTPGSHGISSEYTSATQNSLFESSKLDSSSLFQSASSNSLAEPVSSPVPLAANPTDNGEPGAKKKNRLFSLKKDSDNVSTSVSKPSRRKAGRGQRPFFGSCFACVGSKKNSERVPSEAKPTLTASHSRVSIGSCASRTTAWCPSMGGTLDESRLQTHECFVKTCRAEPGSDSDLENSRSRSQEDDKERREAHKNTTCTYNDCLYGVAMGPKRESGRENHEASNTDGRRLEEAARSKSDGEVVMDDQSSTSLGQDRSSSAGCIPLYTGGFLEDFRFHREEKGSKGRSTTMPVDSQDGKNSSEDGNETQSHVKTPLNSSDKLDKDAYF